MKVQLTLPPDYWQTQARLIKCHYHPYGSIAVPKYHPYAVLACTVSPNGRYSWIPPRLFDQTANSRHLILLSDPNTASIIVQEHARIVRPGGQSHTVPRYDGAPRRH